jgi:fused signal recognition particle receptor
MEIAIVLVVAAVLVVAFFVLRKGRAAPPPADHELGEAPRRPDRLPEKPPARVEDEMRRGPAAERAAEPARRAPSVPPQAEPSAVVPSPPPPRAAVPTPVEAAAVPAPISAERAPVADVQSMRRGLAKSRGAEGFFGRLKALFSGAREIDENIAADIEEVLLTSDVGVATTETILARIKSGLAQGDLDDNAKVWGALRGEARRILQVDGRSGGIAVQKKPAVVLLVGVNGAGKTTTIGKLAAKLKGEGNRVLLAAGDTFRAAAVQQLKVWGERVGCEVIAGKDGADPSSVIFDAVRRGEEIGADVILADTAGRLHTKTNLMAEMTKIARSAGKALAGAPHETLLVIDATNGQNALAQAKEFTDALEVTGIVLTKLDGTAKGGVVLGICDTLRVPVRYVGLGERADDLHEFSPDAFVEALLGRDGEGAAA